ncbi:unnamed protein product [Gongylonema pulchrum]|uniref:Transmembrane protein 18 n=1 Tax=Gongylonema pulchrum TaxID=637853 RepID=A0A183D736_9BILA|nr:unnamed protein product [Gongylonema pulchrum]
MLFSYFLPSEEVAEKEAVIRQRVDFFLRLSFASFFSCQTFDFLFSPIWMHGYIWSLNQKAELDLSTKSAGAIVEHQLTACGYSERVFLSILLVFIIYALLLISGFRGQNQTVWRLLRLSLFVGMLTGNMRWLQMKQLLYPAVHEAFYAYFLTFSIGD